MVYFIAECALLLVVMQSFVVNNTGYTNKIFSDLPSNQKLRVNVETDIESRFGMIKELVMVKDGTMKTQCAMSHHNLLLMMMTCSRVLTDFCVVTRVVTNLFILFYRLCHVHCILRV